MERNWRLRAWKSSAAGFDFTTLIGFSNNLAVVPYHIHARGSVTPINALKHPILGSIEDMNFFPAISSKAGS